MNTVSKAWVGVVSVMFLTACSMTARQADADTTAPVFAKFGAFNRHDVAAIREIYAPAAVLESPDYPSLTGNVRIGETYTRIFDAISDARDSIQSEAHIGDRVYVQFVMTGHLNDPAHTPIAAKIFSIYTVNAGHIVHDSTYYDRKGS
jgi:ketosteroid isomerase-like protein